MQFHFWRKSKKGLLFNRNKVADILKLGCTLRNFANNCLHENTDANIYFLEKATYDLSQKRLEGSFVDPSIVFICKAVVNETFILETGNKANKL